MPIELLMHIKKEPILYHYLKHHSYWHKILKRNPDKIKEMKDAMKKKYRLTAGDKIQDFSDKIMLMRTFIEMLN